MKKPVVSVAMVTCNVDRFLAESIESILGQTFTEFEFIIVDFGSSDQSKSIISSYAAKDSRIRFQEISNCSLPEARNAGCFLAQGKYIAIMDADDVSLPNRLLREVEFMEKHPEVGVVGGAVEWINATGKRLRKMQHPLTDSEIQSALLRYPALWQPSVLIRRDAFVSAGGYRPFFVVAHDYDLWLRIAERFQIANLEEVVLKYRIHPYQVSLGKRRQQSICGVAAQASAIARRNGNPDPLNGVKEITPALLAGLGVTDAKQQATLASDCAWWVRSVYAAGENDLALKTAVEMLQHDWLWGERRRIADVQLIVARIFWRQNRFLSSFLAAGRAVLTRAILVGHPLNSTLRRLTNRGMRILEGFKFRPWGGRP
jgi:glycosyltransferase involved in cell wall biosynthesis